MAKSNSPKSCFYVVFVGACPGIYWNYEDVKRQVLNYRKADFRKYRTREEAEEAFNKRGRSYNSSETFKWNYSRPIRRSI